MLRVILNAYREAFRGLPRPVWALSAVTLVNRAGTMVLPFLVLYFTTEKGFSTREAGVLLGLYGVGAIGGAWVGGWLVDRIGATRVMAASLLLTGLTFLVLGTVDSRSAAGVTLAVLAFVGEAFRPASGAALAEMSPPTLLVRAYALRRLAINAGMTLGPAVGGFLAVINYQWLFRIDAATCLGAAVLLHLTVSPASATPAAEREDSASTGTSSPLRDPVFVAFLLLTFGLASVFFQLLSTFPLTLREHYGLAEDRIGLLLALNTLLIVVFEMVLTHRVERRDPLKILALGTLLTCAGFALLPLGSTFGFALVTVAVWTVGEMFWAPMSEGFVASRAAPAARGRFMGLFVMAWSASFVAAPLGGTFVYDRFGYEALWFGCGGLGLVLTAAFLALSKHQRS